MELQSRRRQTPTMWNDAKMMNMSFRTATMLAKSGIVPDSFRNSPENCLIAIDLGNRMDMSPLQVMQNLYVVKGKPAWSGSFCAGAIAGSGRFTPIEFCFVGQAGTPDFGCYVKSTRKSDGQVCRGTAVTMRMAKEEGWLDKPGSKWRTMPEQMMCYRAASFFAKAYCSDFLLGLPTLEEVQDVSGYESREKTVVTLAGRNTETGEANE